MWLLGRMIRRQRLQSASPSLDSPRAPEGHHWLRSHRIGGKMPRDAGCTTCKRRKKVGQYERTRTPHQLLQVGLGSQLKALLIALHESDEDLFNILHLCNLNWNVWVCGGSVFDRALEDSESNSNLSIDLMRVMCKTINGAVSLDFGPVLNRLLAFALDLKSIVPQ